jgi:hypothetical protein
MAIFFNGMLCVAYVICAQLIDDFELSFLDLSGEGTYGRPGSLGAGSTGCKQLGNFIQDFHFLTKRLFAQGLTGLLASSKLQSSLHGMNSKASELFLMHHSKEPNHLIFNRHNT